MLLLPCCVAWVALLSPGLSFPFCTMGVADSLDQQALSRGGRVVSQEERKGGEEGSVWREREEPRGRRTPCLTLLSWGNTPGSAAHTPQLARGRRLA